jgi:hypothetical protein
MRTFAFAAECSTVDRPSLAIKAFQHMTGHSYQRVPANFHPAGAGISIRPFARSQRRLRHHCEVNVPDLYLQFPIRDYREPVRFRTLPLRSVSRPNRGDVIARNPFSASISDAPDFSPISTPLQVLSRKPSGSKRSTGSRSGNPPYLTFDCFRVFPLLPLAIPLQITRPVARPETRFVRLDYRSVNPGTESIIDKRIATVKRKKVVSIRFQQVF